MKYQSAIATWGRKVENGCSDAYLDPEVPYIALLIALYAPLRSRFWNLLELALMERR